MRTLPSILLLLIVTVLAVPAAEKKSKVPVRKPAPAAKAPPAPPSLPKPKAEPAKKESTASDKKSKSGKPAVPQSFTPPAAPAAKVEWKPVYHKGRPYVPLEQVAAYYDMQPPKVSGKTITLTNKHFTVVLHRGERRVKLNGWTFYFSFSVAERYGKTIVSSFDVRNVLDPIMRPNDRRDPAILKTVIIDPAGGGKETGIKSPFILEKDLTLDVAKQLAEKLKAAGFAVVLTRADDSTVTAGEREKIAAGVTGEALFISLRAGSGGSRGFETSTLPPAGTPATDEPDGEESDLKFFAGNINDRESLALATVLQSSAITNLKTLDLGIKRFRFSELRDISQAAAVCRIGSLSQKEEAQKLATPEYRQLIAKGLFEGVQRYSAYLSDRMEEREQENQKRPLRLGEPAATCTLEGAGITGEQVVLDVPIIAAETVNIDRSKVEVQLFLFEHVNGGEIDMSTADAPAVEWVSVLPDWKASRTETLRATWLRPPFGAAETKAYGKRTYHGYVVRLIYDGRVMDETAFPQNLNRCLYYFTNVFPRR